MQTLRRQLEEYGTLVLIEFKTENGNQRCQCWSSFLKHINSGQLALNELQNFWKHDMQVISKQVIGVAIVGLIMGFAALAALKLAKYNSLWP